MMKRTHIFTLILVLVTSIFTPPVSARAETAPTANIPPLLIAALQTGSKDNGSDEYVAVANTGDQPANITGWQLQYRRASATGTAHWAVKATAACQDEPDAGQSDCRTYVPAHGVMWFASYDLGPDRPSHDLKSGMAARGGQLRLVRPATDTDPELVLDHVSYGTAQEGDGDPAPAPPKGVALMRNIDTNGQYSSTHNNAVDFYVAQAEGGQGGDPSTSGGDGSPDPPSSYSSADITEILPKPASPAIRSQDSFIEIYNPHDMAIDLQHYELRTGSTRQHRYTLPSLVIAPGGYVALKASQTHLLPRLKSESVRLFDPNGKVVSETPLYSDAKAGAAWARFENGEWHWTATPTPGTANQLQVPSTQQSAVAVAPTKAKASHSKVATSAPKASAARKTTTTKVAAKPKATKLAAASSTIKPKTTKSTGANSFGSAQSSSHTSQTSAASGTPANLWLLGSAGTLVGGYAVYEYRENIVSGARRLLSWVGGSRRRSGEEMVCEENTS